MSELTPSEKKKDVKIIDKNIEDEEEAIESYQDAKEELSTKKGKARAAEIQGDEREHKEELEELKEWENSKPVKKSHFEKKLPSELRNQANVPDANTKNTVEQQVREEQRKWADDRKKEQEDWEKQQTQLWERQKHDYQNYLNEVNEDLKHPKQVLMRLKSDVDSNKRNIERLPEGDPLIEELQSEIDEYEPMVNYIETALSAGKDLKEDERFIDFIKKYNDYLNPGEPPATFNPGSYPGVKVPRPEMPEGAPPENVEAADIKRYLPKGRKGTRRAREFFRDEDSLDKRFEELGISQEMLGRKKYVLPKREGANSLSEYVNTNDTRQVIYDENGNPTGEMKPASSYHNKVANEVSDFAHSSHYKNIKLVPVNIMTDEEGNELLNEDGEPRYEVDYIRYVRVPMQANQKYKTDENGFLVTDENGHLIPEKKELALTQQEKELTRPGVVRRTKDAFDPTKTERGNLGGDVGQGIAQRREKKGYIANEKYTPGKMITYKYRVKKEISPDEVDRSKLEKTGKLYYRHIIGYDRNGDPVWEPVRNGWTSYRVSNFGKDLIQQSMYFPNHTRDVDRIIGLMEAHAEKNPTSPFGDMDWVSMVNAAEEAVAYFEMYGKSPDGTNDAPVTVMGIPLVIAEKGKDGKPIMVQRADGTTSPKFTMADGTDIEPMYTTVAAEKRRQNLIKNSEIYTQLALWALKKNYGLSVENNDIYVTEPARGWENGMPVAPTIMVKTSRLPKGKTARDILNKFQQTYYDAVAGAVPEGAQAEIDRMRGIQERAETGRQKTVGDMNAVLGVAKDKELLSIGEAQDEFWNELSAKYGITDDMKKNGGVVGPDGKWLEVEIPGKNGEMQKVRLSPSNKKKINLKIQGEVKLRFYSEDHTISNQLDAKKVIDEKAKEIYDEKLADRNIEKGQAWSVYAILKDEAYAEAREWWDSLSKEDQESATIDKRDRDAQAEKEVRREKGKNLVRTTRNMWADDREAAEAEAETEAQKQLDESKLYAGYAGRYGMNKGTAKKVFKGYGLNGTPISEILGDDYEKLIADPKLKAKIDKAQPIKTPVAGLEDAIEYYNNILSDPKNRDKIKPIYEIVESNSRKKATYIGKKIYTELKDFRERAREALNDKNTSVDALNRLLKKHTQLLDNVDVDGVQYRYMLKSDLKGPDGAKAREVLANLSAEDMKALRSEYLEAYKKFPSRNLATKIALLDDIQMFVGDNGTIDVDGLQAVGKRPVPEVKFTRGGEVVRAKGATEDADLKEGQEGKTKTYTPWKKALSLARDVQLMKDGELGGVLTDVMNINRRIKRVEANKAKAKDIVETGQGGMSRVTRDYLGDKTIKPLNEQEMAGLKPKVNSKAGVVDEEDTLLTEVPQTEDTMEMPQATEDTAEPVAEPMADDAIETESTVVAEPQEEPIHAVGEQTEQEEPTTESKKAVRSWNGSLVFVDHDIINTPFRKIAHRK